jgi:hypothetical protein
MSGIHDEVPAGGHRERTGSFAEAPLDSVAGHSVSDGPADREAEPADRAVAAQDAKHKKIMSIGASPSIDRGELAPVAKALRSAHALTRRARAQAG